MSTLRTLIVEDNSLVRRHLRLLIESINGLDLAGEARDVRQALELFDQTKPDITIVDLCLPSGTGLDILRELQTRKHQSRLVIFSGSISPWEAELCRRAGADHCFNKVLDYDRLRDTLRMWASQDDETTRTA